MPKNKERERKIEKITRRKKDRGSVMREWDELAKKERVWIRPAGTGVWYVPGYGIIMG